MTAREWVAGYCQAHHLRWALLTAGERFQITMRVPCSVRCFRIGEPVEVRPGEECPECGQVRPLLTSWEQIPLGV